MSNGRDKAAHHRVVSITGLQLNNYHTPVAARMELAAPMRTADRGAAERPFIGSIMARRLDWLLALLLGACALCSSALGCNALWGVGRLGYGKRAPFYRILPLRVGRT
jgi:hypothetical protein